MRFICLVYIDDAAFAAFGPADHERLDADNRVFDSGLAASGHLIDSSALASTRDAVTVRRRSGKLSVTDGPFAETREHLGGFALIEARDREEALAIVSRDPMASYASIEIREAKNIADPDWREWADRAYAPR